MKKYILLGTSVVILISLGIYFIFFFTPTKNGYFLILDKDGRKVYADEKDPKMESNGNIVSIKEFLPKSNCTLSCIYHSAAKPFKETEKAYIFAYQIEDTTYYYASCKNEKEVFIGKKMLDTECN